MQKEWRLHKQKFLLSTTPDEVKEKIECSYHKLASDEQMANFIFWLSFFI
jgi:hypothetical protein